MGLRASQRRLVQHGFGCVGRQLERRHCHGRAGSQHGFPASALAAEAGTDGDEDGEAHERTQEAKLTFVDVTLYLHGRPENKKVDPDRQSALGIHLSRMLKLRTYLRRGALRRSTGCEVMAKSCETAIPFAL
ncbi:unnamed protein product [Ixodes hexagonus]